MPTFIVKPKPDEDFYVAWSTIVDAPGAFGDREAIKRDIWAKATDERLDRADEYGTSMCDPDLPRDRQWFGWHDEEFMIREVVPDRDGGTWVAPRENLRAICEGIDAGQDVTPLLRFEPYDDAPTPTTEAKEAE